MMTNLAPPSAPAATFEQVMDGVRTAIAEDLRPSVSEIDHQGIYPRKFLKRVGSLGGYAQSVPSELGGAGRGLRETIQVMEEVSQDCLSTGFCVWCQAVCGWYIQNGESEYLKQCRLPLVASGQQLAGTGLSNPMKHFAGIEKIRLTAERVGGGYRINGALPWVSNVGTDHCFGISAKIVGSDDYLMAIAPGDAPGLTLGDGGHFIALEGSATHNAVFKDVFLSDQYILAAPCYDYIARIRPGFILAQCGFGLGLVRGCVELMHRANDRVGHVNCYLDDGPEAIEADLQEAQRRTYLLASQIGCGGRDFGLDASQEAVACRILASELSLRAAQAAMLACGAAGYRVHSAAARKLRESYFVAIVTPALKHLKKLQHDWQTA